MNRNNCLVPMDYFVLPNKKLLKSLALSLRTLLNLKNQEYIEPLWPLPFGLGRPYSNDKG